MKGPEYLKHGDLAVCVRRRTQRNHLLQKLLMFLVKQLLHSLDVLLGTVYARRKPFDTFRKLLQGGLRIVQEYPHRCAGLVRRRQRNTCILTVYAFWEER